MTNLLERILIAALVLFASAWLLTQAWRMAQPLVPLLVSALAAFVAIRLARNKDSRW